jgi:acetyl esterase/lipase
VNHFSISILYNFTSLVRVFILFSLIFKIAFAQINNQDQHIFRDTSFTIFSAYEKEIKKFPFIEIAESHLSEDILIDSNVVYTSYGNRQLRLDILYPRDSSQNYPVVMLVHGGGWRSGDKSQQLSMAQAIASAGFIAATVEYRLSPEALYPAAIYDLKSAVRWMRANSIKYNIDTNRIAILGCSSGGHLASMLGATNFNLKIEGAGNYLSHSSNVQAVINIDGILDFTDPAESGKDQDPEKPSVGKLWFGYSYKEKPAIWSEASPINYVDENTPPFLFINSSIDRFHAGREILIEKLNKYQTYSEIHTIPDTPHSFWFFHPWFKPMIKIVIEFLNKIFY